MVENVKCGVEAGQADRRGRRRLRTERLLEGAHEPIAAKVARGNHLHETYEVPKL